MAYAEARTRVAHRMLAAIVALITASVASGCTADLLPEDPAPNAGAARPGAGSMRGSRAQTTAGSGAPVMERAATEGAESAVDSASSGSDDAGVDPIAEPAPPETAAAAPDAGPAPTGMEPSAPATTPPAVIPSAPVPPSTPPAADGCITDVTPGDHAFSCDGVTYLVMVDPKCVSESCGLIFDLHADLMSAAQMRDSTLLHQSAPPLGYLVVHPSPTAATIAGTWSDAQHYPRVLDFMMRMQRVFRVDPRRVHVSGFGHGADMAQWFMCNHSTLIASAAALSNTRPSAECFVASWQPRVPYLYMHGALDMITPIERARAMQTALVAQLRLVSEAPFASDPLYTRQRWHDSAGMALEWIEHQYTRPTLGGYCIPGGVDSLGGGNNLLFTATSCTTEGTLRWGDLVLQWFQAHPRRA